MNTLRRATELVAEENDALDIVVCAPIGNGVSRDEVRARCLSRAVANTHEEFETSLFLIDRLSSPTECELDQRTFRDLRRGTNAKLSGDTAAVHVRPSQELLLGLPDVLAWSYRQEIARKNSTSFEPLRDRTKVVRLAPP